MASSGSGEDKYRSFMSGDGEKNTEWRFGGPPNYDVVNKLFEEGRTQIWPPGSLEEKVQNLVKSWEMEMFHKADPEDFKTADPKKLTLSLNGRKAQSLADVGKIGGGYNFFLQTALPDNLRFYNPEGENFNSALVAFTTTFPRGFAVEIIQIPVFPINTNGVFGFPGRQVPVLLERRREHYQKWPPSYLEEKVQNLVKTWEMEMFHKLCPDDYKTADPKKLTLSLNGRKAQSLADVGKLGRGYNFFLQTALPKNLRFHNPKDETLNSALVAFTTTFPRGFAIEVLQVYSGPPVIACKFRRWGYTEGPFKGHAPMGEMVQFFGIRILELDENAKIVKVEFFFNHGELLGGLMKGVTLQSSGEEASATSCPFIRNTG